MQLEGAGHSQSEAEFATLVDQLASEADVASLIELLREDHPAYDQRGAPAVVRMRGWVLLALARRGLPDAALVFVLEELDTGVDPYLVAAAARALRTCARPRVDFVPRIVRALENVGFHDDLVSLDEYGAYVVGDGGTTAVRELEETLRWIEDGVPAADRREADCCDGLAAFGFRPWKRARDRRASLDAVTFEDQHGHATSYRDFFRGRPAVVAFFYTRCENPQKCSLTIAKLAQVQKLLVQRGHGDRVRTAAITYDPAFDLPARMEGYGRSRGVRMDADHRLLRCTSDFDDLRRHFGLGVGFVGSLVNRHRIELFLVDAVGRIASSFERLHWDVATVAGQAASLADAPVAAGTGPPAAPAPPRARSGVGWHALGIFSSVVTAFLPKCPMCVAAYLSVFGIASVERIPYSPVLLPLFGVLLVLNLIVTWTRCRATGRFTGFGLSAAGALTILVGRFVLNVPYAGPIGVALTLLGSLATVFGGSRRRVVTSAAAST